MNHTTSPSALITREAAHWHALQREAPLDPRQQTQFMDWLIASPAHLREYLAIGHAAAELRELLHEEAFDIDLDRIGVAPPDNVVALPLPPVRRRPAPPASASPLRRVAVAAAVACIAIAGWFGQPRTAHYSAARGAPQRFELADHSVLHLNGGSSATVRLGWLRRRIELQRGQASIVVASDRRPLVAYAAGLELHDIGTTFDIDLLGDHARIGVSEGQVRVLAQDAGHKTLADLHAGQSARIELGSHRVSVHNEDGAAITAWWQRRVVFRDAPLREVAQRFNRISAVPLVVDDSAADAMRLTGNLRGDDLHALRAFLEQQPGLKVVVHAGELQVQRKPAQTR